MVRVFRLWVWGAVLSVVLVGWSPSASAQDELIVGPDSYPPMINPLTGLPVSDPDVFNQRPMIVKIVNAPAEARPQWGLFDADIVWEYVIAGGDTRFAAVYYSNAPEKVGPVRSLRLVDFDITKHYKALVVTSGMADGTWEYLRADTIMPDRIISGGGPCPPLCRDRTIQRSMEFTLIGSIPDLRDHAVELGRDTSSEPLSGMAFSAARLAGGQPLQRLMIKYNNTTIDYTVDPEMNVWRRTQDGEVHFDAITNQQLYFDNVLLLEADHLVQPYTYEGYWGYSNFAYYADLIGTGKVLLMRDGRVYEGTWVRRNLDDFLHFYDEQGNVLPFKPGRTMVNLLPRWAGGYQLSFFYPQGQPYGVITWDEGVWLRWGPSVNFKHYDGAQPGEAFFITGRTWDGEWLQVYDGEGHPLWVASRYMQVIGTDIMDIPLVRSTYERNSDSFVPTTQR